MRKRRAELERLSSLNDAVSTTTTSSSSTSSVQQQVLSFQTPTVHSHQPAEGLECDGDDEVKEEFENVEGTDPCLTIIYGTGCEESTHLFHTGDPSVLKYIDNPMFQRNINHNRACTVPVDRRAVNTVEYIVQSKLQQLQLVKDDGTSDDSTRTGLLGLIDSLTQELAALIESLQLSLTDKEMKVSWLEEEKNTQRDALHTEIDDLKHSCSEKNEKFRELQKVEEQICATNRELTERNTVLNATLMEKDGFLTDITAQLHALTVRVGHADTLLANKDLLIEDFQQQIYSLTAAITAQKIADDERQQQLQVELQAYQQKEGQLTTETKALTISLEERDLAHANLIVQLDELQTSITQREVDNARKLADVTASKTAIDILDQQVKSLESEVFSLKHMVSAYEEQGVKYSAELIMLKESMVAKEQQRKMAIQERDSLNDMISMRKQETVLLEQQVCVLCVCVCVYLSHLLDTLSHTHEQTHPNPSSTLFILSINSPVKTNIRYPYTPGVSTDCCIGSTVTTGRWLPHHPRCCERNQRRIGPRKGDTDGGNQRITCVCCRSQGEARWIHIGHHRSQRDSSSAMHG